MIGDILNTKLTFEEKFNDICKYYDIRYPNEIKDFLKDNEGIFVLLDEVKPYLRQCFADEEYCLEMVHDPECESPNLVLRIYVSSDRFQNGISDDIEYVRKNMRPFRRKYGILSEFAINPGVKHV